MPKIMEIVAKEISYNTYKYSFDSIGLPSIDYDDGSSKIMKWQDCAETVKHIRSVDLKPLADRIVGEPPLINYFLDGSRHVFKVDDIAYNKQVFPVVAGQIGVGCCKRVDRRMYPEAFYRELVLALHSLHYEKAKNRREAYKELTGGFDTSQFEKDFYDAHEESKSESIFLYADEDIPRRSMTSKKFYEEIMSGLKMYYVENMDELGMENFIKVRTFLKQFLSRKE